MISPAKGKKMFFAHYRQCPFFIRKFNSSILRILPTIKLLPMKNLVFILVACFVPFLSGLGQPIISSFDTEFQTGPNDFYAKWGTKIYVHGSGFDGTSPSNNTIFFNGSIVNPYYSTTNTLIAIIPESFRGTWPIQVKVGNVLSNSSLYNLVVYPVPKITGFSKSFGSAGDILTINGSDLNYSPVVSFYDGQPSSLPSL